MGLYLLRKTLDLLTAQERRQAFLLFPVMILMALAEVAGVASVAPFLALMSDPELAHSNPLLANLRSLLGVQGDRQFLVVIGVGVLLILILSNVILAGGVWALSAFGSMRNHTISKRLLAGYIHQPYEFFLANNSATLANNILQEVNQVVNGIIVPGLQAVAKLIAAVAVLVLLVAIDPILAALTGTLLGGTYLVIFLFTRRYLTRIGRERVQANHARHQTVNEALGGIKELKLLGRQSAMLNRFHKPSLAFALSQSRSRVIGAVPRYALEAVAFGSIIAIVLVQLAAGTRVNEVVPVLGLYAFAGYRLLPALQQVFTAATQIRYSSGALDEVHRLFQTAVESEMDSTQPVPTLPEPVPISFERSVVLDGVSFNYSGSDVPVLHDVSLKIDAKSSVAFVGPTGAGKTTIVDILLGLLEPDSGEILVDGHPITIQDLPKWQRLIGYVPQQIFLTDDTITRNIALGVQDAEIDMGEVQRAARMAQIDDYVAGLADGYDTLVGEQGLRLSGGQRQRLGIARALYHDPEILVLDEATSALDGSTEQAVFDAITGLAGKKTVVMIAHRLSTVRACDNIFLLSQGRLEAEGDFDKLLASSKTFQRLAQVTSGAHLSTDPLL